MRQKTVLDSEYNIDEGQQMKSNRGNEFVSVFLRDCRNVYCNMKPQPMSNVISLTFYLRRRRSMEDFSSNPMAKFRRYKETQFRCLSIFVVIPLIESETVSLSLRSPVNMFVAIHENLFVASSGLTFRMHKSPCNDVTM